MGQNEQQTDTAEQKISKLQSSNRNYPKCNTGKKELKSNKIITATTKQKIRHSELWKISSSLINIIEAIVARKFLNWIKTINPQIQET